MELLNVAVRFGLYVDLAAAFGVAFFALCAPHVRTVLPLRAILVSTAILGIALSALGLAVTAASMAGVPISQLDGASVTMVLTEMSLGKAWAARVVSLAIVTGSAALIDRRRSSALAAAAAGGAIALGSLAWGGHGVVDEGVAGWLHLGADVAHLLAAGVWVGALGCLVLLVARRSVGVDAAHLWATHAALDGFSIIGTVVVAVIAVTGLANAWLMVGPANVLTLPSTLYGQLLIAKLLLFAVMLALATANRYSLTPALAARIDADNHRGAIVALRISVALETACLLLVMALVAWLGTLQPPTSIF